MNRLETALHNVSQTTAECIADLRRALAEAQRQRHVAESHLAVKLAELARADDTAGILRAKIVRLEADLDHVCECRDALGAELRRIKECCHAGA